MCNAQLGTGGRSGCGTPENTFPVILFTYELFSGFLAALCTIVSNRKIISEWKGIAKVLEVVMIYGKVFFWTVSLLRIELDFFSNRNRKLYRLCHLAWFLL
jgi:hypothetical protein